MEQFTCQWCDRVFERPEGKVGPKPKFCSAKCRKTYGNKKPKPSCTQEGCDRRSFGRGLCVKHYYEVVPRDRSKERAYLPCSVCGRLVERRKSRGGMRVACDSRCHSIIANGRDVNAGKEVIGPVPRRYIPKSPPARKTTPRFHAATCAYCNTAFMHDALVTMPVPKYCTPLCSRRASKARRRLATGRFAATPRKRMALYIRDGWTCQICKAPVDPEVPDSDPWSPTLDHIEPQSLALIPDHSEGNLRLAHRICNSFRGSDDSVSDQEVAMMVDSWIAKAA